MANVRVAVRVRPLSKREIKEGGKIIVEVNGKVAKIRNLKVDGRPNGFGDSREKVVAFGFDYCYWSVNPEDPQYASQDVVFQDLGTEVLSGAAKGYNICLFAYGQTGSGKTYTMLGTPASVGLTPRICEGLFIREENCAPLPASCSIKVSFLEIYNERVRDLLKQSDQKKTYNLRVREHPEMGPYVQGLSQHVVTNYKQVIQLLEEGIANRITAATHVHEASSRSHAIFTIYYTQAFLENNLPSEIASKINLVDLAGSERADPSYCKDRITEGANINKSLVTLGIVISTLAQNSQVFNSCQSLNSAASDGGDSGLPSSPSGTSSGAGPSRRQSYIPYRDSVLTWLLKDSLGGNSRTIMVATVSPAHTSYSETMSTLRYASNAKNIINKPRVNEDANVKLIRELREEIGRLKAMLLSFELRNFHSLNEGKDENLKELILQNELKTDQLSKDWAQKWNEWQALVEHYRVDINKRQAGLVIDSSLPHLMALEDDVLSTGVVLYHLKEGTTKIGRIDSEQEQDIVLQGQWIERDHCTITSACGVIILRPARGARCTVNGREVTSSCRLTQGAVITLGKAQKFRFNHPAEAAVLRQRRQVGEAVGSSGSLEWLDLGGDVTASQMCLCPLLWKERSALGEQSDKDHWPLRAGETPYGTQIPQQQQQHLVGDVRQQILVGQIRAKQEAELEQLHTGLRVEDDQQWLLRGETRLASSWQQLQQDHAAEKELEAAVPSDSWCQTDPKTQPYPQVRSQSKVVHPQFLWRHERNVRRKRASFKLERIIKKQRLLEVHRGPEQLRALCWLQDDRPRRTTFPALCPGALVPGPHRRSRLTSCSSPRLRRPCGWHSAQLRSVFVNRDRSTTLPPMPDPTEQLSEEYLPLAASYPPRIGHLIQHALCSSGEGQFGTARKALAWKGASPLGMCLTESSESASVQEVERMALPAPLELEEPQGKEQDLPEPDNSESDDSQISEDSLAEKGPGNPRNSSGHSYLTSGCGHSQARARASERGFTTSSGSRPFTLAHRSVSLDSLIDAEEEPGDHWQGKPFFGSTDEMPTETFWHLQSPILPAGGQEAVCRLGPISHRRAPRLDAILPVSSSFYLKPQPQPPCEQPEVAVEGSPTEPATILQDIQPSRGSPLVSMDSWFSCDSKINPSSPPHSLCPSPDTQEVQCCGWERPGYWLNTEELKSPGTETILPFSSTLPPASTELPCSIRSVYTDPVSGSMSLWDPCSLLQPGAEGTFQASGVPETAQQGVSETSNSSVSSLLAASASSFTYIGSACERDWAALQQKYLLELSHPVLEATGAPRPVSTSLKEDSGSPIQASGRGGDAILPVGPGASSSPDFNNVPTHLSKIRRLRAEKEQDSLNVKVGGTSDFFTTNEKEVSHSGSYSADVESLTSGPTNAQVSAAENKMVYPMMAAQGVRKSSLEESSQSSKKPGLMTSSDECFILKNPCHHIVTIATKDPHWPRGWAPLRKKRAGPVRRLGQNSHRPPQEEKTDSQESSVEADGRHSRPSCPFPSGPELYLHSAPWNPLPSSLQPPPLETFYVTKSRDALTETALEIPACREARVPSPPLREAWGFGHEHQVLQNVYVENKLPGQLQNQNSKIVSSQQVAAERPVDLNTKEVCREKGKCLGKVKERSHNSVYFFVTQNAHFFPSTSIKVCEFENQVGILNKHSLATLEQGAKAPVQSHCSVSSNSSGSGKPLLACESETGKEEEQGRNAVLTQAQAFDAKRHFPSRVKSDFTCKTICLAPDKDKPQDAALPLKSRSVRHEVSSPETVALGESPAHKEEWRNGTGLLGKAPHSKDGSEELRLSQTESTYEQFQSVTCSQERSLSECKVPGKGLKANPKEAPPGKTWDERVNNADEMARLIRSVMQLENGISEIESKQGKQLHASHPPGVSKEFIFQYQQDQETAEGVLRTGSFGSHPPFKDQPTSPKWTDSVICRDDEAGEVEVNGSTDPRGPGSRFVRGHTYPAVLDTPAKDSGGYLGVCTVCRECTNASAYLRMKASARALPLQPRPEGTSQEGKVVNAVHLRRQPRSLGSLEELETVEGVQESHPAKCIHHSKQEEPAVQGRVKEMAAQRGSLEEKNTVLSTQRLPGLCHCCVHTLFSHKTGLSPSQPDSCMAPRQDLSHTLLLNSTKLPRSYLYAPNTLGISSVDYVLDPTMLKMPTSPLVAGAGQQDQSGASRHHSLKGDNRQGSTVAYSAWPVSVTSVAMGPRGQSSAPGSIPLGAEGKGSASTGLQDQGGDLRSSSMGLGSRVGSPSRAEAAEPRGPDRAGALNGAFSLLERRVGSPLEEGDDQGREVRQEAEDLSPAGGAFSAPMSPPVVPQLEPSAQPPTSLAVLEETGQAKTQGKPLYDVVAGGTVLLSSKTLLEPECSSSAPGRLQCPQMGQSVANRTTNEPEARDHMASLSVEPGHLSVDKRTTVLQSIPPSADRFHSLPSTDTDMGPQCPSRTPSHTEPTPGGSHCTRKLEHFLGADEQSMCHTSSSEITEKNKEATRAPPSADALGSDSLPSSAASREEDRRVMTGEVVAASLSQAPFEDSGQIAQGRELLAVAEGMLPGHQESSPAHQEPGTLDCTWGGGSDNFQAIAQGGKTTCFESHLVISVVQNSASLSEPNQDQGQCLKASTSLEEGRASPKQGTVLPGALKGVGLEAPSQPCVKREGSVGSGPAEAYRAGMEGPRPALLPDQSPGGVREEALSRCPQEDSGFGVSSWSPGGSKTLGLSQGQEESRSGPCWQPRSPQPVVWAARSSPPSTSLCYRDGDLGRGPSTAPLHPHHPARVPSRAWGMERREGHGGEPGVLLAHGFEPKGINVELGPADGSTLEASATAVLPLTGGCSSPAAPDMRTSPPSHSLTRSRSIGDPEKKAAEKKVRAKLEALPFPEGKCSETPGRLQDSSVGGQGAKGSQPKPAALGGPHTLNLSERYVESELLEGLQQGCLGNDIRCLPEEPQLAPGSRDHGGLHPQEKFITELKYMSRSQVDSLWEEEEQQRDQAAGGREDPAGVRSPPCADEGGSDSCQIRSADREGRTVAKSPVSKTISPSFGDSAAVSLGQRRAHWPAAQGPRQPSSGGEQPVPHHRSARPIIAVFSGRRYSRPQFSVVSSSRSLQELNLSVEPPSPTEEDIVEPNRLWTSHPRGTSSEKSAVRTSLNAEGCDQEASSDLDSIAADLRPLPPAPPPYSATSGFLRMPTPNLTSVHPSGALEQAQSGKPERLGGQARPEEWHSTDVDRGALLLGPSDVNPCILPWHPKGPARAGWRRHVFGGAVSVSRRPTSQGLTPPNVAQSSMDSHVEDQSSLFRSHLSTLASAQSLLNKRSSVGNARGSRKAWEVWGSLPALRNPDILISSEGAAPSKGPDKRAQFRGTPDEVGSLRREPPWAEESTAGPVDEIMLLYPSEVGGPIAQSRMDTLEQGTQTLGCGSHWSYSDFSSAQSDLASWASMHNLSLHLSQLLHSTSELLGSLSQPSVAEKEWNAKRDTPHEVPQTQMTDGSTQTTVDEGIQTDLASPPLHLQAPEADPQKVNVILEGLGSDLTSMCQGEGRVPRALQKRKAEETVWKTAGPLDLKGEDNLCRPQSAPVPSFHFNLQKGPFGQNLPSLSPQASPDALLPPSSQAEEPSCLAVGRPCLSAFSSPGPCPHPVESVGELRVQEQGSASTLLVDRASSPILTLSASTPGLGIPPSALSVSSPSALSLDSLQKLVSSPSLPLPAPRPPVGNFSQTTDEADGSQRARAPCGEGRSSLEGGNHRPFFGVSSQGNPQQSTKLQVRFVQQPLQQCLPRTTAGVQSRLSPPPLGNRSQRLADSFLPEDMASLECGPLSRRGPGGWQSRVEKRGERSASPAELQPSLDGPCPRGVLQRHSPCPFSELTDTPGLQGCVLGPPVACQPGGLLPPGSQMHTAPEPQHHGLRDLPVHNKFSDWCGPQNSSPGGPGTVDSLGTRCDCSSGEQSQRLPQAPQDQIRAPEWPQREQIPLKVGAQNLSLSTELTEAKLHHGFGEADALLQVLQSGTGEALAAEEEELNARPKHTAETLQRKLAEGLQNSRWKRSLSPEKQLSFARDFDLPSRRREYLQQLRKDVVETTRSSVSTSRSSHPPSDIELMLQEYQRAREEAKVEIARARDRLRERTEQEKLRIHQQIISQLLREKEKLHTLATSGSRCTSSDGSLSSGVTSGYNSSPALPSQLQSPDSVGDTNLPDSRDSWIGEVRGRSSVRNNQLNLAGSAWKSLAYSRRAALGSCCCSPSSLSSLGTSFSSSYKDLAKHIVDLSMADVMAACSDNLNNLFSCWAAAGWNHQGEEQEVQLYYKMFSSTRHGFLGAGVVSQPLSHVWAAVSDPTLWPLYHKPVQTARLHQRVTNSINLVYLVCNTTVCALKQPRDFCCVCVEAKEGQLSIMAAQSVYDASMPRPSREMVRGEILPSAWILQPLTVEGKEITRVIYLAQVELGAPGFPPQLLSSFIKQQPLVIARLASFLGS
ncbi:stAR-related lipid transfer protein 9 isoform X2 [Bos javanicus]|uniref:stAR-related lipid transfer protein 9 isoform X2 n=1 Tax=Bos javanicus TaxID=9906 RepID=UPI002AA612D7|nr:stAR-related lipid transfer protein 9 isoform X2 [Bos javanicus]